MHQIFGSQIFEKKDVLKKYLFIRKNPLFLIKFLFFDQKILFLEKSIWQAWSINIFIGIFLGSK